MLEPSSIYTTTLVSRLVLCTTTGNLRTLLVNHVLMAALLVSRRLCITVLLAAPTPTLQNSTTDGPMKPPASPTVPKASSSRQHSVTNAPIVARTASLARVMLTTALPMVDADSDSSLTTPPTSVWQYVPMACMETHLADSVKTALLAACFVKAQVYNSVLSVDLLPTTPAKSTISILLTPSVLKPARLAGSVKT